MKRMIMASQSDEAEEQLDKRQKREKNPILQQLNRLAWLLQKNTKSCAAVGLVNNKLLIADNDIPQSSSPNTSNVRYVLEILDFFSMIVNDSDDKSEIAEQRKEIFGYIFDKKFAGEEIGYYQSAHKYKDDIMKALNKVFDKTFEDNAKNQPELRRIISDEFAHLSNLAKHSSQKVVGAFQIGLLIIHRMKKIEDYLKQSKDSLFTLAMSQSSKDKIRVMYFSAFGDPERQDCVWLQSTDDSGAAVIATNEIDVHAESKIVDFLLATGTITSQTVPGQPVYIGISKKCCYYCHDVINMTNQCIRELKLLDSDLIEISGAHEIENNKWERKRPFFLLDEVNPNDTSGLEEIYYLNSNGRYGNSSSESQEGDEPRVAFQKRDWAIGRQIKEKFEFKQQELHLYVVGDESRDWPTLSIPDEEKNEAMLRFVRDNDKTDEICLFQHSEGSIYFVGFNYASQEFETHALETILVPSFDEINKRLELKILEQARKKLSYLPMEVLDHMSQTSGPSSSPRQIVNEQEDALTMLLDMRVNLNQLFDSISSEAVLTNVNMLEAVQKLQQTLQDIGEKIKQKQEQLDSSKISSLGMFKKPN